MLCGRVFTHTARPVLWGEDPYTHTNKTERKCPEELMVTSE